MGNVSVNTELIKKVKQLCLKCENELKNTSSHILMTYNGLADSWTDSKYKEFGDIIEKCRVSLNSPVNDLDRTIVYLEKLVKILEEYDSINLHSDSISSANSEVSTNEISNMCDFDLTNNQIDTQVGGLHFYETTQQTWHTGYGSSTFDSPYQTGETLNYRQGSPSRGGNGVEGFDGTCGLVSVQNILNMAGLNVSESDIVNYASNTRGSGFLGLRRLCTTNSTPDENGGTYATDRQQILRHYGVESSIQDGTIDNITRAVSAGRGVIVPVEANTFWGLSSNRQEGHAIVITSVEIDSYSHRPLGFYVCDSGIHTPSRFVTTSELNRALYGSINVTDRIIR